VLGSYERGRISSQAMADVARERGWLNHTANQFLAWPTRHSTNTRRRITNCHCQNRTIAVAQVWRVTTGRNGRVSLATARLRETEYALLAAAKRGDSAASRSLQTVRQHGLSRSTANDAEQRRCGRRSAGVVSTAFIHLKSFKAIPGFRRELRMHQCCPDETAQEHRKWDVSLDMNRPKSDESLLPGSTSKPRPGIPNTLCTKAERERILVLSHEGVNARNAKSDRVRELGEQSTERNRSNHGNSGWPGKARVVSWAKESYARD